MITWLIFERRRRRTAEIELRQRDPRARAPDAPLRGGRARLSEASREETEKADRNVGLLSRSDLESFATRPYGSKYTTVSLHSYALC
jgi:hypothetical protein